MNAYDVLVVLWTIAIVLGAIIGIGRYWKRA
jgi:uncharacterized membrane protein YhiD involved in acid resistance